MEPGGKLPTRILAVRDGNHFHRHGHFLRAGECGDDDAICRYILCAKDAVEFGPEAQPLTTKASSQWPMFKALHGMNTAVSPSPKTGVLPLVHYVIREKGKIELGVHCRPVCLLFLRFVLSNARAVKTIVCAQQPVIESATRRMIG
jgi:hypothetical protein